MFEKFREKLLMKDHREIITNIAREAMEGTQDFIAKRVDSLGDRVNELKVYTGNTQAQLDTLKQTSAEKLTDLYKRVQSLEMMKPRWLSLS